jgi:hypothetical protein
MHVFILRLTTVKKITALFGAYVVIYIFTLFYFHILLDKPLFHLQYVLFVMLGVILGGLLIESNERLRRICVRR